MSGSPDRKSTGKHTVEVQLLGQRMTLKADEDPRHVEKLVGYVKRKVDELAATSTASSSKLAVLAALNIADDYFRALEETRELKRQVAQKSRALLGELDRRSWERGRPGGDDGDDGQ
jgi:cell division protein ZapA (FtsZ GTPase activity inhibitor)